MDTFAESLDFDPFSLPPTAVVNGWSYRDYQRAACEAVDSAWAEFNRLLIVLATGTGKTVIFTKLTQDEVARGGKVLILAHSTELLDQAADKLARSTGIIAAREKGADTASLDDTVVVASVQTLSRETRLQSWPDNHFTLIIVDEAHRTLAASYLKILNYFKSRVLGVTATADRGDKRNLAAFYEHMPYQFGLLAAVHGGWLVRPRVHEIPLKIDIQNVRISRTAEGADFSLTEVGHRIAPFIHEIARNLVSHTEGRQQGVIFLPSIETASMMADSLTMHGLRADFVSGECRDRDEKIAAFKRGEIAVLCNAMLLIEGFDHDTIDWICMLRPTKIRSLYAQAVGRGTRTLNTIGAALNAATTPEERKACIAASRKPDLKILDFLWLTDSLDLVSPYQLVARSAAVAEQMRKSSVLMQGDLIDMEEQADRDLLKSLEKAVEKNKRKKGRVLDPLELAVKLNDDALANYEPSSRWEFEAPSKDQIKFLTEYGIDQSKVLTAGLAFKLIQKAKTREAHGLCTFRQMTFFEKQGYQDVAYWTKKHATTLQRQRFKRWANKKTHV
ncbi:MAG: DEAD/DEAH box helicase [Candidatus Didemnitutus sp.]|nr:DEAD/DEAH box helicase [Candidatus Didemnitutus sp.]